MKQRVEWIDVAKGLTIFLVVWGHLIEHYNVDSWIYYYIYAFHMPCFFFLSGYVFNAEKYNSLWELIKNKFKTLIIPIYAFGLINMSIMLVKYSVSGDIGNYLMGLCSIKKWICTIFLIRGSGYFFFWFMSTLFFSEIILYLQIRYMKNDLIKIITSFIMFVSGYIIVNNLKLMLPGDFDLALFVNIFLLTGYLARERKEVIKFGIKQGVLHAILFFALGYINWYFFGKHVVSILFCNILNPILFIATAVMGTFAFLAFAHKIGKNKIIEIIGSTSLITYCMQGPLNRIVYAYISVEEQKVEVVMFFCAVIIVAITTSLGVFVKRKMPFLLGRKAGR